MTLTLLAMAFSAAVTDEPEAEPIPATVAVYSPSELETELT